MRHNLDMKKKFLAFSGLMLLLTSCGGGASSGSVAPGIRVVQFFDDSPEPQLVGYSYVIEGRNALDSFQSVDENGYDQLSRCGVRPENPGDYYVFSGWKGEYEDGSAVDLTNIQSDCNVYAQFDTASYYVNVEINDRGEFMREADNSYHLFQLHYGENIPDSFLLPGAKEDEAQYGSVDTFTGYQIHCDKTDETVASPIIQNGTLHWEAGELPAEEAELDVGTLYVELPPADEDNPTEYPISYCYAPGLVGKVGSFGKNTPFALECVYESESRSFPVYLFDSSAKENLLHTFYVPYTEGLTLVTSNAGLTISSPNGDSYLIENATSVEGYYYQDGDTLPGNGGTVERYYDVLPQYEGVVLDTMHIMGCCYLYAI